MGSTKKVRGMVRENDTKQGHLPEGTVLFNEAFTTGNTLKP